MSNGEGSQSGERLMVTFVEKPQLPEQVEVLPYCLDREIPPDCEVRKLQQALDKIDWRSWEAQYAEVGRSAYPPKVLCGVLMLAYSEGLRASRRIEKALHYDLRYRWLAGGLRPDHTTLARFRRRFGEELKQVLAQTARLCAEAGLVLLETVATDGSKIAAHASRRSLYDAARLAKEEEAIARMLADADAADSAAGDGAELRTKAQARQARATRAQQAQAQQKLANVSQSEPESRVMKTTTGLRPAYNPQLTADSKAGVIVAAELTDAASDAGQLPAQVEQVVANLEQRPDMVLADGGYCDEGTLLYLQENKQEALLPIKENSQEAKRTDLFASRCFDYDADHDCYLCPASRVLAYVRNQQTQAGNYRVYRAVRSCRDCSFFAACVTCKKKARRSIWRSVVAQEREHIRQQLATPAGKARYRLRKQVAERPFAHVKRNLGFTRFGVVGKVAARAEWFLVCCVCNLGLWLKAEAHPQPKTTPVEASSYRRLCAVLTIWLMTHTSHRSCRSRQVFA